MKWLTFSMLSMIACFIFFSYMYSQQEKTNQKLVNRLDSLHDELLINKMELFRYEVTMEYLNEVDSTLYKDIKEFHDNETE